MKLVIKYKKGSIDPDIFINHIPPYAKIESINRIKRILIFSDVINQSEIEQYLRFFWIQECLEYVTFKEK